MMFLEIFDELPCPKKDIKFQALFPVNLFSKPEPLKYFQPQFNAVLQKHSDGLLQVMRPFSVKKK